LHPGSKFIHTVRDEEGWLKSVYWLMTAGAKKFAWDRLPKGWKMIERLYGTREYDEDIFRRRYRRHNEEVLAYFSGRPDDLLVIDITKGDGFEHVCPFLGRPVPEQAFPHSNIGKDEKSRVSVSRESPVFILGMHRSGTSLLTGTLQAAGLHLGEVNDFATHNRKGNKEQGDFRKLNEALLASAGGSWSAPPSGQVAWSAAHRARGRRLVARYEAGPRPWGFKDPRAVFTVEGWQRLAPGARRVGVFRHPSLVAASLAARPGPLWVAPENGLELWWRYNSELLRLWTTAPFPLVEFSTPELTLAKFGTICERLGLGAPGERFLAADLVHHDAPSAVDARYTDLLNALREAAASA
jgi:hypothetical protein